MSTFAAGQLLAQLVPSSTAAETLFSVSDVGLHTEITLITATVLTAGTKDITVYHDDDGTTYGDAETLALVQRAQYGDNIAFRALSIGGGIFVRPGGSIGVKISVADAVAFSVYGITADIVRRTGY